MSQGTMIDAHSPGKAGLIVGLAEEMGVVELFNEKLSSNKGRPEEIPYGVLALMMMVNMCDDHHPLCRLEEYFAMKDLEGIFHYPIRHEQINDDRFGHLMDRLHDAGPREIFKMENSASLTSTLATANKGDPTRNRPSWASAPPKASW